MTMTDTIDRPIDETAQGPTARFVNVGERTNVTGSAKFKKLILDGDYTAAVEVARQQVENGAQIIDVNMDEGLLDSEEAMVKFLRLLAAFVLNGFANGLPATLFLFFVARVLEAPQMQGPFLFLYFLCGVAGVPLWLAVSRRFGKHRTWSVAMLGACAIFITVPLLGPGDLWGFAAICVLTGLALGADLALPSSIQADVIDVDTVSSGARCSGLYFALWGLATKLSLALAVGLAFPVLELAGFRTDATGGGAAGLGMLVALYAIVPVGLKLAAIALMWRFPLDAVEHARLSEKIAAVQARV